MQSQRTPDDTVTYFIQAATGGPIKIGRSAAQSVSTRLTSLQIGNPHQLRITRIVPLDREAMYHRRYARLRIRGEWFSPASDLATFARAIPDDDAVQALADYREGYLDGWRAAATSAHDDCIESTETQLDALRRMRKDAASHAEIEAMEAIKRSARGSHLRNGFDQHPDLTVVPDGEAA